MKFSHLAPLTLLSLFLAGCYSLAKDVTPPPNYVPPTAAPALSAAYPAAAPNLANGAAIYLTNCVPCHGPTGLGDGPQANMLPAPVPALGSPEIANRAAPAAWYHIVTQGNLTNFMPGFTSLSDQERWDVVAYAHSLSLTPTQIEAGKAIYTASCAACHGLDGRMAANANFTDLQWLSANSLDTWAASVLQGKGAMPGFEGQLENADIYAALAYARTFAYTAPQALTSATQTTPEPAPALGAESTPEAAAQAEAGSEPAAPPQADEAAAATSGQISGRITSGAGGALPSGLKVVLYGFDHGPDGQFSETFSLETEVAADGTYRFENIEMPTGRAFYVSLTYKGVEYVSEPALVQDGQTVFELPIQIYESTSDPGALEIGQAHVLLEFSTPGRVTVIHFLTINNPSEKTIVPPAEGQPVLSFRLPQGVENLQFEGGIMGGRFLPTAEGFGDQARVPPGIGKHQLVYAYDLPYAPPSGLEALWGGGATELTVPLTLPAQAVMLLVPEGVTATGTGFTDAGLQNMGNGMNFQMYRAGSLAAGEDLSFTLSGAPRAQLAAGEMDASQTLVIGLASLGIILIAVSGFLYWRNRSQEMNDPEESAEALEESGEENEPNRDEDEILDAILALDDQFKAGNIAEAGYRKRRAELKAKLSARQ